MLAWWGVSRIHPNLRLHVADLVLAACVPQFPLHTPTHHAASSVHTRGGPPSHPPFLVLPLLSVGASCLFLQ